MNLAYLYPDHLGLPHARILQVADTVAALARRGARVHLLVGRYEGLMSRLAELGLQPSRDLIVEPLAMMRPGPQKRLQFTWNQVFNWSAGRCLARLAGQGVRLAMVRHLKLTRFLLGRQRSHGLPLLYEAHEIFSQTAGEEGRDPRRLKRLAALEARVLGGVQGIVAISQPLLQVLRARPEVQCPLWVAPSGVGREFFGVPDRRRQSDLVAYTGGLQPWKGADLLVRAMANLPAARLEILGGNQGSGDWRRLLALVSELGLDQRVRLRPRAGRDQVLELLTRARVAVWPGSATTSRAAAYTSPLKLFEYLAAGCAVVAPDLPAAQSLLQHGKEALLFAPDDPAALAAALERLLADPSLSRKLAQAGRDLARRYTWERRADRLLTAMTQIAK